MKKQLLFLFAIVLTVAGYGQQLPQYTQFFINTFVMNPAVAGTEKGWVVQTNNRFQWVGINDAPRTHILSAQGPMKNMKMGLGGYVFADITGPTRRMGFSFAYSYHLKITSTIKLGMGLGFGGLQYVTDGSQINLKNPDDVALSEGVQSVFLPDASVGFHMFSEDFYVGFSIPQLIGNKIKFFDNYDQTGARLARHVFLYGGYKFRIGDDFIIEPAALFKYVQPAPVQFEFNVRGMWREMLWLGVTYRMDDAVGVMAGFIYNDNLRIAYSYDIITTNLKNYSGGSHEIMIGFKFRKKTGRKPYILQD